MELKGAVAQVLGPVVDVEFDGGKLPEINEALTVELDGKKQVMEVAQHVGGDTVRCIMLSPSEGLGRGDTVIASGHTIETPVGEGTLGRLFNVLGEPIDEKGPVQTDEKWSIHREPPAFANQNPTTEILETGIKVIDLLAPYARGGNRPVRRRRCRQDRPDSGADSKYCRRARRLLHLYRRRRTHP